MTGLHPVAKASLWLLLAGAALVIVAGCSASAPLDRDAIIQDDRMEHGSFFLGQVAPHGIVVTTLPNAA